MAKNLKRSEEHRVRNGATVLPVAKTTQRLMRSGDLGGELLPGIRNDIALSVIAPMLPWSDIQILFSVSPDWRQAIKSHLVHNFRVRTHSTETFVVIVKQKCPREYVPYPSRNRVAELCVCSMRDKSWRDLPRMPHVREGFPSGFQCISLDGKIYVLGGDLFLGGDGSKEVYVLDLAGQGQWKQCASMQEPRQKFGSAVIDGKIYVFGGISLFEPNCGCEVYDPKVDAWSWIQPMTTLRYGHQVAAVGEELFVHGGELCNDPNAVHDNLLLLASIERALFLEVYHPGRNEWRLINPIGRNKPLGEMFSAQGKFFMMDREHRGIYVLDIAKQSWTLLQSSSFPDLGQAGFVIALSFLAVDDELLLLVGTDGIGGIRLLRSRGFGTENQEIVWETQSCPNYCEECSSFWTCSLLCSIQL